MWSKFLMVVNTSSVHWSQTLPNSAQPIGSLAEFSFSTLYKMDIALKSTLAHCSFVKA